MEETRIELKICSLDLGCVNVDLRILYKENKVLRPKNTFMSVHRHMVYPPSNSLYERHKFALKEDNCNMKWHYSHDIKNW